MPNLPERIAELADEADLDEEPDSHFDMISSALDKLEGISPDDETADLINAARRTITAQTKRVAERKEERDSEKDDNADWTQISAVSEKTDAPWNQRSAAQTRSIFDDVDQ
ncbi:hypothetical protein BPNPMPFG_002385 [Mesorhizobium sp. AR07]|uniref:hypothetical protein n=1 Tax=Mesorhizobium sp. AR07 TaxID=2865838 RepID=UPI00215EA633|nr:hypothetical protein [Mesorhizobium sp. AR07]UVK46687.1 hypothetical protein BPNPMPFG_002385 [Mesorhizobium sp. AR07]